METPGSTKAVGDRISNCRNLSRLIPLNQKFNKQKAAEKPESQLVAIGDRATNQEMIFG